MASTPPQPLRTEARSPRTVNKKEPRASGFPPYLKGVAIAVGLIVIGFFLWFFVIRDTSGVKAHIKGGAWLTKKAGNSEALRGLDIFVLRSPGSNQQLLSMLQAAKDDSKWRLDELANYERVLSNRGTNELMESEQKTLTALQEKLAAAAKVNGNPPVDMAEVFGLLSLGISDENKQSKVCWAAICSQQLAVTVHTDVDGKYSIEVPCGDYYLYAMFESSNSKVDWFVPVKVGEAKDLAVDLHNENAERITNKNK